MNRWIKLAVPVAVAAIVAGLSGGAGATSSPAGATKAGSALHRAASARGALLRHANFKTVAGVRQYFRAIGVDPRGVVIQRGARNYAGPSCPGAGWACTSTAHPVVQLAAAGGKNTFLCTTGKCAVVQTTRSAAVKASRALAAAAFTQSTAKCIKTTGVMQNCSISQNDPNADNTAVVYMNTSKMSGLTQTALYTASITQRGHSNKACVLQNVNMDGSTTALRGKPVAVTLRAHESITISQDSPAGNRAADAATSAGGCDTGNPLTQTQTLSSTAIGTAQITQLMNDPDDPTSGANLILDIKQNQSTGFFNSAGGINTITFKQKSNQLADASGGTNTTNGPVVQTQSRSDGGILATVNQFSTDQSTIAATQEENQCEMGKKTGSLPTDPNDCFTFPRGPLPSSLTQRQSGPIANAGAAARATARRSLAYTKKGDGSSVQGNNAADTFTVSQTTTQKNDTGQHQFQKNLVQGDCMSSGTCNADQNATVNGTQLIQPTQSGKSVSTSINCTGSSCPATPIIDSGPTQPGGTTGSTNATFTFHDAFAGATFLCQLDGGGYSPCSSGVMYTVSCGSSHTFSVEATDNAVPPDVTLPATFSWTVPICPPTIDSGPTQPTDTSFSATFTFQDVHTPDAVPTFQCQLDGGPPSDCNSGTASYTVNCGSHTFSVTAGDQFGDISAATTYSWTVANICFDGSPGTNAPPGTLGPYTMTAFGTDSQPVCPASGSLVTGVTDPAGTIGFSSALSHDLATISCWATWSNGYTGDVYDDSPVHTGAAVPAQVTITLPAGTNGFYFYAEPVNFSDFTITATAQNGTTSNPVTVNGDAGAKYFGFYGTGGVTLASITVTATDTDGFAIGEFGINKSP
jgi:hypothetical protein